MSQISEAKLQIVRGLIEQAPDSAVRTLLTALSDGELDAGLAAVKTIIDAEAADRRARNAVLAPIAPLCAVGGFSHITFPPRTLAQIWKGLKALAPGEVDRVRALLADWLPDESSPETFDTLCATAAVELLSATQPNFAAAAQAAEAGSGLASLIGCLDLAPVTRRALDRLPDWLGRMTEEKAAALRLAYRDVVAVADDGGPRFFEMLAGALAEPWLILRVISGAMGRPAETYLASSELANFGERLLDAIDGQLEIVSAFDINAGAQGAHTAANAAMQATLIIAEFETSLVLSPEGAWGRRLSKQKRTLASSVELRLREVDDAVSHALPLQTIRLGPRSLRGVPKLTADPDPIQVARASTLLSFLHEVRLSAQNGGFASARAKAVEILEARLDAYVEDILSDLRAGEVENIARARAFLEIAARFCGLARDEKSAQIVRRRAAAA
jgi:hypothetical protein